MKKKKKEKKGRRPGNRLILGGGTKEKKRKEIKERHIQEYQTDWEHFICWKNWSKKMRENVQI